MLLIRTEYIDIEITENEIDQFVFPKKQKHKDHDLDAGVRKLLLSNETIDIYAEINVQFFASNDEDDGAKAVVQIKHKIQK